MAVAVVRGEGGGAAEQAGGGKGGWLNLPLSELYRKQGYPPAVRSAVNSSAHASTQLYAVA